MTIDQIEGNEPIHENWGTSLGDEIDEVLFKKQILILNLFIYLGWRSS